MLSFDEARMALAHAVIAAPRVIESWLQLELKSSKNSRWLGSSGAVTKGRSGDVWQGVIYSKGIYMNALKASTACLFRLSDPGQAVSAAEHQLRQYRTEMAHTYEFTGFQGVRNALNCLKPMLIVMV